MADRDNAVAELKALLEAQTKTLVGRLMRVEAAQENIGGRTGRSVSEAGADNVPEAEAAGSAASERRGGVETDSLLQAVGEVEIRGGTFA